MIMIKIMVMLQQIFPFVFVFTCTYSLSCILFVFFFSSLWYFANQAPLFLFTPYVNLVENSLSSRPFQDSVLTCLKGSLIFVNFFSVPRTPSLVNILSIWQAASSFIVSLHFVLQSIVYVCIIIFILSTLQEFNYFAVRVQMQKLVKSSCMFSSRQPLPFQVMKMLSLLKINKNIKGKNFSP